MNKIIISFLAIILFAKIGLSQSYTLSGYVKEANSSELLLGTTVYVPDLKVGTTANGYGFYSITLPKGIYNVIFSFVGYETKKLKIDLNKDIEQDIILNVEGEEIEEVIISANKTLRESNDVRSGVITMPIKQIKNLPSFLGEKDILKIIQLMPGVQHGTEGQSGIYVRGGGPDQNLLILDDAPVYNAQHLFGFFSVFNGDALRSVEVIKGGFSAKYGGRLSSVINMNMKDGNKEHYTGEVGIGLLSSRAVIEGPIVKDKASFVISGRRTYIDLLTAPIMKATEDIKSGYFFYDLNAKINYIINNKNKLYLSGYFGRDKFYMKEDNSKAKLGWGNQTATLRWNHKFTPQLFANISAIYSRYRFVIGSEDSYSGDQYSLDYKSGIDDVCAKIDFNYYPTPKHTIIFGISNTFHIFTPKAIVKKSITDNIKEDKDDIQKVNALESGIYIEDTYKPFNRLQIMAGLRYSLYSHKKTVYNFLEPRLSASFKTTETSAVKLSFARMGQYIHLLSNTGIGLPTDLWIPSTTNTSPQKSWQIAGGVSKDFINKNISVTLEAYYKNMKNIVGMKEGSSFMQNMEFDEALNTNEVENLRWEQIITRGDGKSYGTELMVQRKAGKITGWVGYTLSWTKHKFPELNFGEEFWAKYDRRHDISIVAAYDINDRIKLGATWVFATGNAFTFGSSRYESITHNPFAENQVPHKQTKLHYPGRNTFRMENYHRLDLGIKFTKERKRGVRTWDISIYNVYCRKNPFFYFMDVEYPNGYNEESVSVIKRQSLFPILPSITYSFKFK